TAPASAANFVMASRSRTSNARVVMPGVDSISDSLAPLMSVAQTRAPVRAKASAVARPMPCAAAVTTTCFPLSSIVSPGVSEFDLASERVRDGSGTRSVCGKQGCQDYSDQDRGVRPHNRGSVSRWSGGASQVFKRLRRVVVENALAAFAGHHLVAPL